MSEISYEDLGILTIQSLLDSTIENIRQMKEKLDDSFGQVSEDLKWMGEYGTTTKIPRKVLYDFPQLEHPVIQMAWTVREDCNSLLHWLIDGEHERVIPLEQANPQEYSDRIDGIDKQITQDIKDKKDEAVYCCAEVYCLVEGLKAEVAERDLQLLRLNHDYNESTDGYLIQIDELKRDLAFVKNLHRPGAYHCFRY